MTDDRASNDIHIFFEKFTSISKTGFTAAEISLPDDWTNTSSTPAGADNDYGDKEEWEREWDMGLHYAFHDDNKYWQWMNPPRPVYITKTGKTLTDADIEALADEAERGYDIKGVER